MEHIRNFLAGMSRVLMLAPPRDYVRPSGGFRRDAAALRGDARKIGDDLRRALRRHGKPV